MTLHTQIICDHAVYHPWNEPEKDLVFEDVEDPEGMILEHECEVLKVFRRPHSVLRIFIIVKKQT